MSHFSIHHPVDGQNHSLVVRTDGGQQSIMQQQNSPPEAWYDVPDYQGVGKVISRDLQE